FFSVAISLHRWFQSRSPRCVPAELPSAPRTATPPEIFPEGGAVCLIPVGSKPPLLAEREMIEERRSRPQAGGVGVGGAKPGQGGEGAKRPDLEAVLRSEQVGP